MTGSILSGRVLLGMGSNPAEGPFYTFLLGSVVPQVVGSILSGCLLLGMGSQRQAFSQQGHLPR